MYNIYIAKYIHKMKTNLIRFIAGSCNDMFE